MNKNEIMGVTPENKSFLNVDSLNEQELAQLCVDTAALHEGEDPQIFWGDSYGERLASSQKYINQIGLDEAKKRFKKGELNFPG